MAACLIEPYCNEYLTYLTESGEGRQRERAAIDRSMRLVVSKQAAHGLTQKSVSYCSTCEEMCPSRSPKLKSIAVYKAFVPVNRSSTCKMGMTPLWDTAPSSCRRCRRRRRGRFSPRIQIPYRCIGHYRGSWPFRRTSRHPRSGWQPPRRDAVNPPGRTSARQVLDLQ